MALHTLPCEWYVSLTLYPGSIKNNHLYSNICFPPHTHKHFSYAMVILFVYLFIMCLYCIDTYHSSVGEILFSKTYLRAMTLIWSLSNDVSLLFVLIVAILSADVDDKPDWLPAEVDNNWEFELDIVREFRMLWWLNLAHAANEFVP